MQSFWVQNFTQQLWCSEGCTTYIVLLVAIHQNQLKSSEFCLKLMNFQKLVMKKEFLKQNKIEKVLFKFDEHKFNVIECKFL